VNRKDYDEESSLQGRIQRVGRGVSRLRTDGENHFRVPFLKRSRKGRRPSVKAADIDRYLIGGISRFIL
jgi:hypothetical protein